MPWKAITPMSERLRFYQRVQEGERSMTALAQEFGISRKTAYKWKRRIEQDEETGAREHSRRPHSSPTATEPSVIIALRGLKAQYPMWGPRKLHRLLHDQLGDATPSLSTVQRVLQREGLTTVRPPVPRHEAVGRFERPTPNDLWQTDFTAPFPLANGQKLWPLPVLDDHSRYCLSLEVVTAPTSEAALAGFVKAAHAHGLPQQVLSDHGSAFGCSPATVSAFTAYLWALGLQHIQGRIAHPQTQGKTERFNRTLQEECLSRHAYSSVEDWNRCLEEYRQLYNTVRPHEALGDEPPASRYRLSAAPFHEPQKDLKEGEADWLYRKVDSSGKITLLSHPILAGKGLAGWTVGARYDGGGYWTLLFRGHALSQWHLAKTVSYQPKP
jgi:transposase InsO family protein